jgi:arabinosaccharide transport system substrate-binding protein
MEMKESLFSRREFLKLTSLAAAGLALAGCGGGAATEVPEEEAEEEPAAEAPPSEPTPLLFWFQAENHEPEYTNRTSELEEAFNVKITWEIMSRDAMTQKFPATLMAGSGFPDIIEQNAGDVVKFMKGDDSVIPFLDLKPALDESEYADDVLANRNDRYTKDGKLYGFPHDVHPVVLLYHDRAWKDVGVDLSTVETYDDYLAACQTVEAETGLETPDGRPIGVIMDCLSCTNLPARMMDLGIWFTNENGEPMLNTPEMKQAAENWMLFHDYYMAIDWGNQVAMLKEGQVMSQFCPDWLYGIHFQGTAEDAEWLADSPMRMTRLPGMSADDSRVTSWGGTSASVPKQSTIAELATDFLLYLYFDNSDGQLGQRFVDTGILPPVKSAWELDVFHEPVEYLGGQVAGEVFIEGALDLPTYYEQWTTQYVRSAWDEQFPAAWEGEITLDEAIEAAHAQAVDDIEQNA